MADHSFFASNGSAGGNNTSELLLRAKEVIDTLQSDLLSATNTIQSLQAELLQCRGEHTAALQREAVLMAALKGLQADEKRDEEKRGEERHQSHALLTALKQENEALRSNYNTLKLTKENMEKELYTAEVRIKSLNDEVRQLRRVSAEAKENTNESSRKIQELTHENTLLQQQLHKQNDVLSNNASLQEEVLSLRSKIVVLDRKLSDVSSENQELTSHISLLQSQLNENAILLHESRDEIDRMLQNSSSSSERDVYIRKKVVLSILSWLRIIRSKFAGFTAVRMPKAASIAAVAPLEDLLQELLSHGGFEVYDMDELFNEISVYLDDLPSVRLSFEKSAEAMETSLLQRLHRFIGIIDTFTKKLNRCEAIQQKLRDIAGTALSERSNELVAWKNRADKYESLAREAERTAAETQAQYHDLLAKHEKTQNECKEKTSQCAQAEAELATVSRTLQSTQTELTSVRDENQNLESKLHGFEQSGTEKNAKLREYLSLLEQQLIDQEHAYRLKLLKHTQTEKELRDKIAHAAAFEVPHRIVNWLQTIFVRAEALSDSHTSALKESSSNVIRLLGYLSSGDSGSKPAPAWLTEVSGSIQQLLLTCNDAASRLRDLSQQLKDVSSGLIGDVIEDFKRSVDVTDITKDSDRSFLSSQHLDASFESSVLKGETHRPPPSMETKSGHASDTNPTLVETLKSLVAPNGSQAASGSTSRPRPSPSKDLERLTQEILRHFGTASTEIGPEAAASKGGASRLASSGIRGTQGRRPSTSSSISSRTWDAGSYSQKFVEERQKGPARSYR